MMVWSTRTPARGSLRRWLQAPGSLSARLAATGQRFTVQVLRQGRFPLAADEACVLGRPGHRVGYVREVVLRVDGVAKVFARSVTTHVDSIGAWRPVRGLGSRPLADVLFRQRGIKRRPLEFAGLVPASRLQRQVCAHWHAATGDDTAHGALPARRSVFVHRRAALLVMEVFMAPTSQWDWTESVSKVASTGRKQR